MTKLDKKEALTRVHFSKEDSRLVHVTFHNRPEPISLLEGRTYHLEGWQNHINRYNILSISHAEEWMDNNDMMWLFNVKISVAVQYYWI